MDNLQQIIMQENEDLKYLVGEQQLYIRRLEDKNKILTNTLQQMTEEEKEND